MVRGDFEATIRQLSPQMEFAWQDQPGWPVLYCSNNVERFLGYQPDALVGSPFDGLIHPDDLSRVTEETKQAKAQSGELVSHQDYRLRASDGRYHWVEDITVVECDGQSGHCYFIGCLRIVDQRHANEVLLRESQQRLALVLEGTRLGMWDWYPKTNEVVFDERWAQMLGLRLADLDMVLSDWSDRVHPDDIDGCMRDIQAHMRGEVGFYENLHRMRHSDGSWHYILDRGRIVERDQDGTPVRFTGTHTDVTELKQAELAARDALAARDRFFSAMSHELRTPMHAILGLIELCMAKPESEPLLNELNIVQRNSEHLLSVLRDILDVAKLDNNQLSLNPRALSLPDTLARTVELFQARAHERNIDLRLELGDGEPWVLCDRQRLVQVLTNLLSNAIKYTQANGQVVVRCDQAQVVIADNGCGIADVETALAPFKQEQQSMDGHNTGLGLSICSDLCQRMAIGFHIHSALAQGTSIQLDFSDCLTPAQAMGTLRSDVIGFTGNGERILIVDDNATNQLVAKAMLADSNVEVTCVFNGQEALAAVPDLQPDIIFMDLHMPVMNGVTATQQLRAQGCSAKIIALSADGFEQARSQALAAGMDDYLVKPFSQATLLALLHRQLRNQGPG